MQKEQLMLAQMAFELLETNMEAQRFIFAYLHGYRGYVPKNAAKELNRLIRQAFILRKCMMDLRPKGFDD